MNIAELINKIRDLQEAGVLSEEEANKKIAELQEKDAKEKAEAEEAAKRAEEEKNNKLADIRKQVEDKDFEELFDLFVPASGDAETIAGELLRAAGKIRYRWYNDGDRFFESYGKETCGAPAAFIVELSEQEVIDSDFENILITIAEDNEDNSDYENAIESFTRSLVNDLVNNHLELFVEKNTYGNMFSASADIWDEYEPKYELDVDIPSELQDHIDNNDIQDSEVEDRVTEYCENSGCYDADVSISWGTVYIENLNKETYDELESNCYEWLQEYAEELDEEFGSAYFDESDVDLEDIEDALRSEKPDADPYDIDEVARIIDKLFSEHLNMWDTVMDNITKRTSEEAAEKMVHMISVVYDDADDIEDLNKYLDNADDRKLLADFFEGTADIDVSESLKHINKETPKTLAELETKLGHKPTEEEYKEFIYPKMLEFFDEYIKDHSPKQVKEEMIDAFGYEDLIDKVFKQKLSTEEIDLSEMYLGKEDPKDLRYIKVSPLAAQYVSDIIGQLSDGYWENSSMERYWKFVMTQGDNIVVSKKSYEYNPNWRKEWRNAFYSMTDDEIKEFFANKIKFIVKQELKDNGQDPVANWKRTSTYPLEYLHGTIGEAYRAYDELKGRRSDNKTYFDSPASLDLSEQKIQEEANSTDEFSRADTMALSEELADYFLKNMNRGYTIYSGTDEDGTNVIIADIEGDWKHDHMFFDRTAAKFFNDRGMLVDITEQDNGSGNFGYDDAVDDSYESEHVIKLAKRMVPTITLDLGEGK